MRKYQNWVHKINSWKYLAIWRTVLLVFPHQKVPHFYSPPWIPFRRCWKSAATQDLILIVVDQFSSVIQLCLTLCDPMDCSTPGLPVHHQLPEFTQTHVHWVSDAIHLSHPLSSPSLPAFNLSQHQGLSNESVLCIRWPKVLDFQVQLQLQSFQWIFRTNFL